MTKAEAARLLAWMAAFDRRKVGEMDVEAWHAAVGDLTVQDALEGVTRWYRDRADYLMPSHLREAVKLVRADRYRADRIRRAEERGLAPALETQGVRMADLPAQVQEQLRSAGRDAHSGPDDLADAVAAERWVEERVAQERAVAHRAVADLTGVVPGWPAQ